LPPSGSDTASRANVETFDAQSGHDLRLRCWEVRNGTHRREQVNILGHPLDEAVCLHRVPPARQKPYRAAAPKAIRASRS
jgi:hypothetical protein